MKGKTFVISMLLVTFIFMATSVSIFKQEIAEPLGNNVEDMFEYGLYCSMVEQWNKEEEQKIPLDDRTGWPPFRGQCK